ncbi:hypothetical protein LBMAG33_6290 [Candidatus Levyibacteriota bacterium]|nr:hypothetical protein [Candidatus Levybacteria bacterium]MSU25768.1 hypothetical protein [Candidatus Levybacteria bacterium]GDX62319.1 hypothetical protein LBMAG33_6290 [Candidatus Levybacteria bacterium]
MHDLTQRQIEILKSLIEEYIESAEPVGSDTLEKKHNLSASPATIRNDMVHLTKLGYLRKLHASAGRMPTPKGMRFYVKQLMKEKELSVAEEVAVKEGLWDFRLNDQRFFREIARSLAEKTKAIAIVTTDEGDLFAAGYANILDMPEFYDIDITKTLLSVIDEYDCFKSVFQQKFEEEGVHVCLGEDLGPLLKGPYGVVFTDFKTKGNMSGDIGILGPERLNYMQIIPIVRYYSNLAGDMPDGW